MRSTLYAVVAVGPVVDADDEVERRGADHRQGGLLRRDGGEAEGEDQGVTDHLHGAGAPATGFLQVDRHHPHAAQAGPVADQDEHTDPEQEPAHDGGEERVEMGEAHEARKHLRKQREEADGAEGLDREAGAQRPLAEKVEGQIDDEEQRPEAPTAEIVGDEGEPRGAPREQPCVAQHQNAQGGEQAANDERLHILEEGVAHCAKRWRVGERHDRVCEPGRSILAGCLRGRHPPRGWDVLFCGTSGVINDAQR